MSGLPFIHQVVQAQGVYGARFRYPIDVVNHENRLEDKGLLPRDDRMTCRGCNRFANRDHITGLADAPRPHRD